jgi:carbon-monoxide dehydrogenase large subunit
MVASSTARARLEDPALVTGRAAFLADLALPPGALHAHFVRSPIAAGQLVALDLEPARRVDGVVAVFDAAALDVAPYQHFDELPPMPQPVLVADRVRHVGEALALIVATSQEVAADAADLVDAEIELDHPIVDPSRAVASPPLHPDAGSNLVLELAPDEEVDPFRDAAQVFELAVVNQRVASAPIECDGIIVTPTEAGVEVWCTLQGVHPARAELARGLGLDPSTIRVRAPVVGGGFGGRASVQVEYLAIAKAALELGRPIRWLASRTENLTGMPHGRGYTTRCRLGVDASGRPIGLEFDTLVDAGSVAHMNGLLMVSARRQAVGLYRIPSLRWRGRAVLTNTTPVGAYRGAGQPEANHARERLLDVVARRLGQDPIDYRLAHLLRADELPRVQPGGVDYDTADPRRALERAVEVADVASWRRERRRRRSIDDRRRIGVGVGCYAQTSGRGEPADGACVRVDANGAVTVSSGSASHGQSHRTMIAALVAERLGVDPRSVELVDADTDAIADGLSTGGSRSSQVLASVVAGACVDLVEAAKPVVADLLEVSVADLVVEPAGFGLGAGLAVAGVPTRRLSWAELADRSEGRCLQAARSESVAGASHPYGAHVTVVEVDIDTGLVGLLRHVAVDDCGVALQPRIVEGQQHGGSAAGLSQVLWEDAGSDPDGTLRGASLLTYLLPASSELCPIDTATLHTPTERNPLGTRGIGENGCNGAIASAHNAVIDALAEFGVEHLDLPLSPERIWRALHSASDH